MLVVTGVEPILIISSGDPDSNYLDSRVVMVISVTEDWENVTLEAGYPEAGHEIGKIFSLKEPYINAVVNLNFLSG